MDRRKYKVYHFVENFKFFQENLKIFSEFLQCSELQLSEVTTVSCRIYPTLALKGLMNNVKNTYIYIYTSGYTKTYNEPQ